MAVTLDANGYYEVPYDSINDLSCCRPKQQRRFRSHHQGVVKDTAILTDASSQTHTVVNERETGSQSLHVDLVGVVDEPISISIPATGPRMAIGYWHHHPGGWRAPIDKAHLGEWTDTPLDPTRKPSTWCWKGCRKGGQGIRRQWQGADPDLPGLDGRAIPSIRWM